MNTYSVKEESPYFDFTIKCIDGDLYYYRIFMMENNVMRKMLSFQGLEASSCSMETSYKKLTMIIILRVIDPRSRSIGTGFDGDIKELLCAANYYEIQQIKDFCDCEMKINLRYEYLCMYDIYFGKKYYEQYLTLLVYAGLLAGNADYETYLRAFKCANFSTVARQYIADGFEYDEDIAIPDDFETKDLLELRNLFKSAKFDILISAKLIGRLELLVNQTTKTPIPPNKLSYFRQLYVKSKEFRKRFLTQKVIQCISYDSRASHGSDGSERIAYEAQLVWNYYKSSRDPEDLRIFKEIEGEWIGVYNWGLMMK